MPCTVVSIEVAEYNGVVVGMSEDRVDIKRVASGARRSRRRVEVEENDVGFVDLKADGLQLGVGVGEEGGVNEGVGDGVMYEERHSTPPTPTLSALIDEGVAGNRRRAVVWAKLRFLEGGDADAVVEKEGAELVDFVLDAIAVPLEEDRKRRKRRRRRRSRVGFNPSDEQKGEDEEAAEFGRRPRKARRPAD